MKQTKNNLALLSVYDKTGIVELAKQLASAGYIITSSGGTAKKLTEAKVAITPVEKITGNPE